MSIYRPNTTIKDFNNEVEIILELQETSIFKELKNLTH